MESSPSPPPSTPWWKNPLTWFIGAMASVFVMFGTAVAIQTTAVAEPDFPFAQVLLVGLGVGVGAVFILAQVLGHRE